MIVREGTDYSLNFKAADDVTAWNEATKSDGRQFHYQRILALETDHRNKTKAISGTQTLR